MKETQATEVRKELDRLKNLNVERHTGGVSESIESLMKLVVEEGDLTPDAKIEAELSLTFRERLTGSRTQDMTAVFLMGMFMGTALERDVPKDSEAEENWRDGGFTLPKEGDAE
jgi:hypothetical protein